MNELGLTDFESLQSDELVIDGLDVEGALATTKARGETLLRRRKIIRLTSILSAVAIAVLSIGTVVALANSDASEGGSVRTATRSETTVPTTVAPTTSVVENTIHKGQVFSTKPGTVGYYEYVNNVRVIINPSNGKVITVIPGAPK